ncbi:MAG: CRISPR system precrRNA processing endoribonuclease RAMP protein Cas6 [Chloroflexota bacterium]|nr:CRISPR system precrRNA processing endoribonuclease RAMP protein Cas6 [Chloroflexota bacterium]
MEDFGRPELGVLILKMEASQSVLFRSSPARSLHAALLRRLELLDSQISFDLHKKTPGAPSTEHAMTVSTLSGSFHRQGEDQLAVSGQIYEARITAMLPEVIQLLDLSFNPQHPLGQEPLILEHVPFQVIPAQSSWEHLANYGSLLTLAKPERQILLEFCSATKFNTSRRSSDRQSPGYQSPALPEPERCIGGYLRKWNAFSPMPILQESLMDFVRQHMSMQRHDLRSGSVQRLGKHSEYDCFEGNVKWQAGSGSPALLRQVNALVDFSRYCGTGMKTAQGMGQTRRVRIRR